MATDYLKAPLTGWALKIPTRVWGLDAPKLIVWLGKTEINEVFLASEAPSALADIGNVLDSAPIG